MAADDIRINGFTHSWASTKTTLDGEQYVGISKISWDHAIEEGLVRGQGGKPLGRTRGQYMPGAVTLTMRKSSAMVLKDNLAKKSSDGKTYGETEFPIVVQYLEPDDTPITVELNRCRFLKSTAANEQSADPTAEDIELSCLEVVENGKKLFSDIVVG
ncbi:MAG: hypothetical protein J0L92_01055 [Deltaproteobacteria bacterium]|nr:hypothetical protein [Deltaproteobacteria bacterium]